MHIRKPLLIIIDGPIGVGKTTVARLLHRNMKRSALVCLDHIRWQISDYNGSQEHNELSARIGVALVKHYLDSGFSVIVEKAFYQRKHILEFLRPAASRNVQTFVFKITAPFRIAAVRAQNRLPIEFRPERFMRTPVSKTRESHMKHGFNTFENFTAEFDSAKLSPSAIKRKMRNIIAKNGENYKIKRG